MTPEDVFRLFVEDFEETGNNGPALEQLVLAAERMIDRRDNLEQVRVGRFPPFLVSNGKKLFEEARSSFSQLLSSHKVAEIDEVALINMAYVIKLFRSAREQATYGRYLQTLEAVKGYAIELNLGIPDSLKTSISLAHVEIKDLSDEWERLRSELPEVEDDLADKILQEAKKEVANSIADSKTLMDLLDLHQRTDEKPEPAGIKIE